MGDLNGMTKDVSKPLVKTEMESDVGWPRDAISVVQTCLRLSARLSVTEGGNCVAEVVPQHVPGVSTRWKLYSSVT